MSNIAKLKKKAAEYEQQKKFDKALALYVQILDANPGGIEEVDVALYNRVGDLLFRQGDIQQALTYYEKAVDHYAESGFFNNAIALCNKILRQSPGRTSIYYKLGKISAHKGFKSDAKQNFLEYADRMQKAGQMDEAFRALKEFADLCPDQDDIRLMLAEQLTRRDRKGEALEQLQTLYDKLSAEGREAEARATAERMRAIDPSIEPRASGKPVGGGNKELVFLDVSFDPPSAGARNSPGGGAPRGAATPGGGAAAAVSDLPLILTNPAGSRPVEPSAPVGTAAAVMHAAPEASTLDVGMSVPGLEPTSVGGDAAPLSGSEFAALTLDAPVDAAPAAPNHDLALPGELPPLDLISADPLGGPTIDFDFGVSDPMSMGAESLASVGGTGDELPTMDLGTLGGTPSLGATPLLDDAPGVPAGSLDAALLEFASDTATTAGESQQSDEAPMSASQIPDGLVYLDGAPPAPPPRRPATEPPLLDPFGSTDRAPQPAAGAPLPDGDAAFLAMMSPAATKGPTAPPVPAAPVQPAATGQGAETIEALRERVLRDQSDWGLRRRYAEALLEGGEREGGMHELELAMVGFERAGDLDAARSIAEEIIRINPGSVRHHQKRVEYAFRTNDKGRLCDAYLQLADALFRTGQAEKSRSVYKRVLELSPHDARARAALGAFGEVEEPAPSAPEAPKSTAPPATERRVPLAGPAGPAGARRVQPPRPAARTAKAVPAGDSFVNLGELLRDESGPKSTRMVVAEQEPTGDEQVDFADMLRKFKQGIAENVDEDDYESHYDLGVAFKEMGLLDEAIGEFQKALRSSARRVRTYEALGQCFMEKRQLSVAATLLERALAEPGVGDDELVGVLYLLGYAYEALQRRDEALAHYHRVFAVDIQFRDVAERLAALEKVPQ